jgi:hypothetical protein
MPPASPAATHPPLNGLPHHAPRAKRLIYLHLSGGPSQLDTFDHKPDLGRFFGKDLPPSVRGGQRITTMTSGQGRLPIAPSLFAFARHGRCGAWVSELLPHTAGVVDDLTIVRSLHTDAINHDPACTFLMTGNELPGRASLGSWLSYGLGSANDDLPAFAVLTPRWSAKAGSQPLFTRMWSAGALPGRHAGVALRSQGDPVLFLDDPPGVGRPARRDQLDALGALNRAAHAQHGDPQTLTRIAQYELAFRMQSAVPELVDLAGESPATLALYGPEAATRGTFAASCLLARRMVERGVRVVKILHRGWDQHGTLPRDHRLQCRDVDQACAGLIGDLKARGLLDDTLVVCAGEFGRTVYSQGTLTKDDYGRDHHPRAFSAWLAGGGIKRGHLHGESDDFSYNVVRDPVGVHDLNATILHCMGIDHQRLSLKVQGLDQRLTGVEPARVVEGILA